MAESFMNKNVNITLIFIIILVVGAIAAGTIYFQDIFVGLTGNYSSISKELKSTQEELANYKVLYTETALQMNRSEQLVEQEKADLRKVYIVKKDLADDLNQTLVNTQNDLTQTKEALFDTSNKLTQKTNQYNTALGQVTNLTLVNSDLKKDVSSLKSKNSQLQSDLAACQGAAPP